MPVDQWTFLDADDSTVADAGQDLDDGPETAALHEDPFEDGAAVSDPGRSDVDVGPSADGDQPVLVRWFADEDDGRGDADSADHEPDLVELLITQHYAFADSDD